MKKQYSETELMGLALGEQKKCSLYPKVGAVIAKDGYILSKAYKGEVGAKHAERIAIEKISPEQLAGATIVTTLEPCIEISPEQPEISCTDLIINRKFGKVIIGVLDPFGKIYCQGFKKLLAEGIAVNFFESPLRELVESTTFKFGEVTKGVGSSGKRRVAVVGSGKNFTIQYSETNKETIEFRWQSLQFNHGCVDIVGDNDSIRCAIGATTFNQISDPLVFREPCHYARMRVGDIAVIYPSKASFLVLVQLTDIEETDIFFQWQIRRL